MANTNIDNSTGTRLPFSVFNQGDNGIPFSAQWIEPGKSGVLDTGDFDNISVGMQAQEGGRWIGADPAKTSFSPSAKIKAIAKLESD